MILRTGPSPSCRNPWPSSVPIKKVPPGKAIMPSTEAFPVRTPLCGLPEDSSEICFVGTQQDGAIP